MNGIRHKPLVLAGLALLLILTGLVYWPGLGGPLLLDDQVELGLFLNPTALHAASWPDILHSHSGPLGRPLSRLSFWLSANLSENTWGWKAANLGVHLAVGGLIFWLSVMLFPTGDDGSRRYGLALVVTGLWLLHPLQVSTVLYAVQRMAQLSTLGIVAGLLCYAIGRQRQMAARPGGEHLVWASFLIFWPLALLAKENGVLLPIFTFWLEVMVFHWRAPPVTRRILMGFYGGGALLVFIVLWLPLSAEHAWWNDYSTRDFTLGERLLTEPRVLLRYLFMLLAPIQHHMGFFHDDLAISQGLWQPPETLWALGILLALILSAAWRWRIQPLWGLGIVFFLTAHLLESTLFPLELVFEHRNYLAAFGVCLAVVSAVARLPIRRPLLQGIAVVVLMGLAVLTGLRSQTWATVSGFYTDSLLAHPTSERAAAGLAETYLNAGNPLAALATLARHKTFGSGLQQAYIRCRAERRLAPDVLEALTNTAIRHAAARVVDNYVIVGLIELANLGLDGRCQFAWEPFAGLLRRTADAPRLPAGNRQKLLLYLAHYQWRQNRLDDALQVLQEAHACHPGNPTPLFLSVEWLLGAGQLQAAEALQTRALQIPAATTEAFRDLREGTAHLLQQARRDRAATATPPPRKSPPGGS
ncbi:protein O-mannosyl-transferase [Gammaproteobacteria bacterium]